MQRNLTSFIVFHFSGISLFDIICKTVINSECCIVVETKFVKWAVQTACTAEWYMVDSARSVHTIGMLISSADNAC